MWWLQLFSCGRGCECLAARECECSRARASCDRVICVRTGDRAQSDRRMPESVTGIPNLDNDADFSNFLCGQAQRSKDPSGFPPDTQDTSDFWHRLQGLWYRQIDGLCVGEICGDSMLWHIHWRIPQGETPLQVLASDVIMFELDGCVNLGKVHLHAQASIHWSDGDVWLQK
ncbi:UBP19 [Symbiodinium natans]|uniref:UBP19 protein n=1 Tax=Symbiodinium natans TaxID=878477 RepID=A0A812TRA5_9DINO|nr:UBP19 [Symbiodinium natans]